MSAKILFLSQKFHPLKITAYTIFLDCYKLELSNTSITFDYWL